MFLSRLKKTDKTRIKAFNELMKRADILLEQKNDEGLKDLIKLVLRPIQSAYLLDPYDPYQHFWTLC